MKRLLVLLCLATLLFVGCSEKARPVPKQMTPDEEKLSVERMQQKDAGKIPLNGEE